ncbi:pantetheine-phosphate adenylyltransferase [Candidatus Woesearchaeota archaeon]|nr:pantetheine-phosphate adenylyltransferase [Candidatus Woesearchaeota archaeon]
MKVAVYPGSFDPVTNGHLDVIKRALKIFGRVIIAVGENPQKKTLFSVEERVAMLKAATKKIKNVEVEHFNGLLITYAKKKNASAVIRGLRAVSDFENELQLALMNRKMDPKIETVFIMTRGMYCYLSASIVKEAACLGGNLKGMVPPIVQKKLKEKYKA